DGLAGDIAHQTFQLLVKKVPNRVASRKETIRPFLVAKRQEAFGDERLIVPSHCGELKRWEHVRQYHVPFVFKRCAQRRSLATAASSGARAVRGGLNDASVVETCANLRGEGPANGPTRT